LAYNMPYLDIWNFGLKNTQFVQFAKITYITPMTLSDFINANLDWFDPDQVDQLICDGSVCCGSYDSEHCKCPK
jgi:hypothetical protein